jgi:hybrid cluster-associated redox disulfide protein
MLKQTNAFDLQMSVADLLRDWPQTIPVFLKHGMACVGCSMASFETLGGAAQVYGLPPDAFARELRAATMPPNAD